MTTRSAFYLTASILMALACVLGLVALNQPDPLTRALAQEVDRFEFELTNAGVAKLEVMSPSRFHAGSAAAYITDTAGNEQVVRMDKWPSSIPELAIVCKHDRCHASATAVRGQASVDTMRALAVRVITMSLDKSRRDCAPCMMLPEIRRKPGFLTSADPV